MTNVSPLAGAVVSAFAVLLAVAESVQPKMRLLRVPVLLYGGAVIAMLGAAYTLKKNGTSFGTVVISAAGVTGAYTVASATDFAVGDVYTVVAPATPDATLASGAIVTRCTRL